MAQRNGRASDPAWAAIAWMLWRYKRLTFPQIARHLRAEGWKPSPAEIEAVVMERVAEELQRFTGRRKGV